MNIIGLVKVKHHILILFFVSLIISFFLYWSSINKFVRLNTDWDASLPTFYFLVDYVREYKKIPSINPYISTGIPVIADPTSTTLNPLLTPLMIAFGVDIGIKMTYVFCIFMAGLSMWYLLKTVQISGPLRLWGALLFMTSGNMAAYWASGSVPKFLTFPFIPFYVSLVVQEKPRLKNTLCASLFLAYILFSGYMYMLWFLFIITLEIRGYYLFFKRNEYKTNFFFLFSLGVLFLFFSSPKLLPYIREVVPNMQRYFPIDPYLGSIHLYLTPIGFLMPLQINFYDRPFIQRITGIHYNWHEYYAFISPFPFIFLLTLKKILRNPIVKIFLILLFTGALYIALAYPYSPFYLLFHLVPFARNFRVPQRMYEVMSPVVITLLTLSAQEYFRRATLTQRRVGIFICIVTLISTITVSNLTLYNSFVPYRTIEESIVKKLRDSDPGTYYVASMTCCLQTFLVQEKIPIINYQDYGWIPKTAPKFLNEKTLDYDYSMLYITRPRYILADKDKQFGRYGYKLLLENEVIRVWKTDRENIIPQI